MMDEGGEVSRSHGLSRSLLEAQSQRLGIPIIFGSATWGQYEEVFIDALRSFSGSGLESGVFGDIDVDPHREWVERVCDSAGVHPYQPLWQRPRRELLTDFIDHGFKATVVVVRKDRLDTGFLGQEINHQTIAEMEEAGIDASGELGEYHTMVTAGPIFSSSLQTEVTGRNQVGDYAFLEVAGA